MRIVRIFFLLSILICSITLANAQESYVIKTTVDVIDYLGWTKKTQSKQEQEYGGSPYLNENFINGNIFMNRKYLFNNIPLRYNIYHDEIEFLDKGIVYAIAPSYLVDMIIIDPDTFVVDTIQNSSKKINAFFKLLLDGKVTILLKMNIILQPGQGAKLYSEATPPKFTHGKDFIYAHIGKSLPQKIRNMDELIALINDNQKLLTDYVKKEKLSSKKTKDFIKLAAYYNSL